MNEADLSELADRIVRSIPFDRNAPAYTIRNFQRKLRRNHQQEMALRHCESLLDQKCRSLYEREIEAAMRRAMVTERQAAIFRARLAGATFESIAEEYGVSKQAICKLFANVRRKVRLEWQKDPYRGLHQIYRAEICRSRKAKSLRRHDN